MLFRSKSDQVPQQIIDELLKDALTAPSWSNTRPFKVAIATGAQRDRISHEFQNRWEVVSTALRSNILKKAIFFLKRYGLPTSNRMISKPYVAELKPRAQRVGKEMYEFIGVKRSDRVARDKQWAKNYEFFGAPTVIFVFVHSGLHEFSIQDAGILEQTIMLSAHANGLGTCAQGSIATWASPVKAEFEIPKDYKIGRAHV